MSIPPRDAFQNHHWGPGSLYAASSLDPRPYLPVHSTRARSGCSDVGPGHGAARCTGGGEEVETKRRGEGMRWSIRGEERARSISGEGTRSRSSIRLSSRETRDSRPPAPRTPVSLAPRGGEEEATGTRRGEGMRLSRSTRGEDTL